MDVTSERTEVDKETGRRSTAPTKDWQGSPKLEAPASGWGSRSTPAHLVRITEELEAKAVVATARLERVKGASAASA